MSHPAVRRLAAAAYPLFAGWLILFLARVFYGEMLTQTGGEWSAPLDDVFIHFDFARSTARGFPFQWSEGNGYSSGQTSISYPFVLALGYWLGFRGTHIMVWAAIVACCSLLAVFLVVPRLARGLPHAARFILPPAIFSVGALCWSLFSGMEVAWFLAIWALALSYAFDHRRCPSARRPALSWKLGLVGILLVATRPEASTTIAVLGIAAAAFVARSSNRLQPAIGTLLRVGLPPASALGIQAVINKVLTGEFAAAGAIVKLAWHSPHKPPDEKWAIYQADLKYSFLRNIDHHFSTIPSLGWIPIALAAVALISPRTRTSAAILLSSAVSFVLLVATNGQVRWQNERYTMPAVAWLLLAAGLGLGVLLFRPRSVLPKITALPRLALAAAAVAAFANVQTPRMRDQVGFFGLASKNIRDQQVTVGRVLRYRMDPPPQRILVGDAGAIMYASDLPGLDIIGLGGFRGMPFARASSYGPAAIIELIERIPPGDRPDVLAIYPSWWGPIPDMFGRLLFSVPACNNVICGAPEKAVYAADWSLLNTGDLPSSLKPGEIVADKLDVADIVDEYLHHYQFPHSDAGHVELRILSDPYDDYRDVLDGGRRYPEGATERFELTSFVQAKKMRLIVRTAPPFPGSVDVTMNGTLIGSQALARAERWVELSLPLPSPIAPNERAEFAITAHGAPRWTNYHVWLVASP